MAKVIVNDNHLVYGGVGYFRGHAEAVELGSIGEKRTPLTKLNYLEVEDRIPAATIGEAKTSKVDIDFTKTSKSAFGPMVTTIIGGAPVKLTGDATFEKLKASELSLIRFSVTCNQMRDAANASPEQLRSLADWGGDARIAHQVFVVVEASSTSVIPIVAGTCFAYLLAKIDWNRGKTKIDDLDDDPWSFG
jgi:hypothetical protein